MGNIDRIFALKLLGFAFSGFGLILFLLMVTTLSERKTIVICITEGGLFDTQIYTRSYLLTDPRTMRTTTYVPILMFTVLLISSIMFPIFLVLILKEWKKRRISRDSIIPPELD